MKVRKHFRTSSSTINYIISDFNLNRIIDKDLYFKNCVTRRMVELSDEYDQKLDKILSFIIIHCDFDKMPMQFITQIILSLSKVTNALSKGFMSIM